MEYKQQLKLLSLSERAIRTPYNAFQTQGPQKLKPFSPNSPIEEEPVRKKKTKNWLQKFWEVEKTAAAWETKGGQQLPSQGFHAVKWTCKTVKQTLKVLKENQWENATLPKTRS